MPHEGELVQIDYQVLTSADPSIFNLGGDLTRFLQSIRTGNREWLYGYAKACIYVLYPNIVGYDLPITTISLVTGDALGGGFEAALSSHVLIAERGTQLGLPEILFNLFPGMGAFQLLARRLGAGRAEKMISSGRMYSADELYEMGVVDVLAEPDEGESAVHSYIRAHRRRALGFAALRRVRDRLVPIIRDELMEVCDIWVDTALRLSEKDQKTMLRLLRGQNRIGTVAPEIALNAKESA